MAKRPRAPHRRDPAKHSKKDPAKPTRAKAARPDTPTLDPSLADLLNPGIGRGRAGIGAQTGMRSNVRRESFPSPHPGRADARPSASLPGEGREGGREGKRRNQPRTSDRATPTPIPSP